MKKTQQKGKHNQVITGRFHPGHLLTKEVDLKSDSAMKRVQDKEVQGENRNNIHLQDNITILPNVFNKCQNRPAESDHFAKKKLFWLVFP